MTDCYCDYDPPEFYHQETRRARKEHRCVECGSTIRSGETYEHVRAKWDGLVDSLKTCERCVGFRVWMTHNFKCFCWAHRGLFETARELVDDVGHLMLEEAPGVLFEMGRKYLAIKARAKADRELRTATT